MYGLLSQYPLQPLASLQLEQRTAAFIFIEIRLIPGDISAAVHDGGVAAGGGRRWGRGRRLSVQRLVGGLPVLLGQPLPHLRLQ